MLRKLVPLIGIQFILAALVLLNGAVPQAPLSPSSYFNPPYAYAWLNTIFLLPAGAAVAYISSKAFLTGGRVSVQLMGCGILALCFATMGTWSGTSEQAIGFYYIMLNLFGILFGAVFLTAGVLVAQRDLILPPNMRMTSMVSTYAALALVGGAVWLGAAEGWIPSFFENKPTTLSVEVLVVAAVLFSVACAALGRNYFAARSEILYWYVIGMLLVLTSILAYLFIRHPGDPISWLYRGTTFLYGGAFLNAVLTSQPDEKPAKEG
jgi:hypothetical protein